MTLSRALIASLLTFYCSQAFSTIEITGVTGASNWEYDGNTLVIWAGTAGPECPERTCNNCTDGPQPCNENRINSNGSLTINFTSDSRSGIPVIADFNKQTLNISTGNLAISANTNTPVAIPWSQICAQSDGNNTDGIGRGNCNSNTQIRLFVGIDGSSNGLGDGSLDNNTEDDALSFTVNVRSRIPEEFRIPTFSLFPGDEKVFMLTPDDEGEGELGENKNDERPPIEFPSSFPSYDNTRITHIRFYYEEVPEGEDGCAHANSIGNDSLSIETEVIDISDNSSFVELSNLYFRGFQNNVTYVFKIALVDEAGNVGLFYNGLCDRNAHVITPTEVNGLLKGCFIATAAYGQSHKILETFYQFRDQKLRPYALGKIIHDLYYTYSPPLANIIRDNILLKYIARILLIPFWIYAFLALQIGHLLTFFLLASFMSILIYFFIRKNIII